jgi:hypothetical protein
LLYYGAQLYGASFGLLVWANLTGVSVLGDFTAQSDELAKVTEPLQD